MKILEKEKQRYRLKLALLVWQSLIVAETNGDQIMEESNEIGKLSFNERIINLESENIQQKKEIFILKTNANEDRIMISDLSGKVERLQSLVYDLMDPNDTYFLGRPKRPARLLPLQLLLGKEKNETYDEGNDAAKFYGPPTNCHELGKLGYTLNGYYLVKGRQNSSTSIVKIVYCAFRHMRRMQSNVSETWIGNVEVKTTSVHFYVQRKSDWSKEAIIPFEVEKLNVGGAMNLSSGVFFAPVPGTYYFAFSCVRHADSWQGVIELQLNGEKIGSSMSNTEEGRSTGTITLHSLVKLKKSDRIWLHQQQGTIIHDRHDHLTHFSGWLVEEDSPFLPAANNSIPPVTK